ncbi:hypothetical protein AC579_1077 [Pseudocercospora musae]|uniref:Uncharacterized protein n=1 Tax=Pseudocercospora musae TaxID=113226 RepID=A0A139H7E3_9PEZI|nr:hypothetical protein AC579_1077 [Pseudocercospora musae]
MDSHNSGYEYRSSDISKDHIMSTRLRERARKKAANEASACIKEENIKPSSNKLANVTKNNNPIKMSAAAATTATTSSSQEPETATKSKLTHRFRKWWRAIILIVIVIIIIIAITAYIKVHSSTTECPKEERQQQQQEEEVECKGSTPQIVTGICSDFHVIHNVPKLTATEKEETKMYEELRETGGILGKSAATTGWRQVGREKIVDGQG